MKILKNIDLHRLNTTFKDINVVSEFQYKNLLFCDLILEILLKNNIKFYYGLIMGYFISKNSHKFNSIFSFEIELIEDDITIAVYKDKIIVIKNSQHTNFKLEDVILFPQILFSKHITLS